MTMETTEQIECPECGNRQDVTVWRSINVSLDPSLRDKLFDRRINAFRCEKCEFAAYLGVPLMYHDMHRQFVVQFYPPDAIEDDQFVRMFEPSQPVTVKGPLAVDAGYLARPHLVFDMDEMARCVAFFERLLPEDVRSAGEQAP